MESNNTTKVALSAINPYLQQNIPSPIEVSSSSKEYVQMGADNLYFNYLKGLYENAPTLKSIIEGTAEYIAGDDAQTNMDKFAIKVNGKGENLYSLVGRISLDLMVYGGFAINVIRNQMNEVSELYHIPFAYLRSDKENEVFYYCEEWEQYRKKVIQLPKFALGDSNGSSVFYYKGKTEKTYPLPIWSASVIPAELEKSINEFHLNSINNGFMGSYVISFNNGVPNEAQQEEIERKINEKFGGKENAGRILIAFNRDEQNKVSVEKMDGDDFADRYEALSKRCREQLFVAFRAVPSLFGLMTESKGFSKEEFLQAFALYNKTMVRPRQNAIVDAFDQIFGIKNSISIIPFNVSEI